MKIDILCTDPKHPVNAWLSMWASQNQKTGEIVIARHSAELKGGDFLFLVSCHEIIRQPVRDLYKFTLVLHASKLPQGKGMSPHVWQVLENKSSITVTLLNAEDALDSGDIWQQISFDLEGHELHDEIHAALFDAEMQLMSWAVQNCWHTRPRPQSGEGSFYRKRTPEDSRLDPTKSIESQFDLLRICDPERYPAFFDLRGKRYTVHITKVTEKT